MIWVHSLAYKIKKDTPHMSLVDEILGRQLNIGTSAEQFCICILHLAWNEYVLAVYILTVYTRVAFSIIYL